LRQLRLGVVPLDTATALAVALVLTALASRRAAAGGGMEVVSPAVALLFVFGVVVLTVAAPYVLMAVLIPVFAAIPMLKVLAFPQIGPLKDAMTVAAGIGVAVLVVMRRSRGESQRGDAFALGAAGAFLGLYVLNLGGTFAPGSYDSAWVQGVRLAAEPILLLAVGLACAQPRKTYRWAMISLVATAVVVALIGLWQQAVGQWALVDMGYEFDVHVRTFNGKLRSFGSLDDSFAYAAFLLFGLVGVAFYVRRRWLAVPAAVVVAAGLYVGYVRTSIMVVVALAALWLARLRRTHVAVLMLVACAVTGFVVLVKSSEATESRVVRADENTYLTVNGRTDVWKNVLRGPNDWVLGRGVGEVGTAAERGSFGVFRTPAEARDDLGPAVDSGYLAAVADTGLFGLLLLGVLFARLGALATVAIRSGRSEGWVAAGLLIVMLLDAVTRASFNGFPTAFLGLLLIGLALNAANDEEHAPAHGPSAAT
jgi:hypothetical protein